MADDTNLNKFLEVPVLGQHNAGDTSLFSDFLSKFSDFFVGSVDPKTKLKTGGLGGGLIDTFSSGLSAYNGFKNAKTAQDTLDFQKQAFSDQFGIQKQLVNSQITDRNNRGLDRNPNFKTTNTLA